LNYSRGPCSQSSRAVKFSAVDMVASSFLTW
jgi:hypothetical protein